MDTCDIRVVEASTGYINASGRGSANSPSYYVIHKSTVAAAPGHIVADGAFSLGRPWGDYARVAFQFTDMTSGINRAGWARWSAQNPTQFLELGEYKNTGPGSQGTRALAKMLSQPVAIDQVLGGDYRSWVDTRYLS